VATRIEPGETARHATKRMARAELVGAAQAFDGPTSLAERIHAVRTSIKKVRALARLVRPVVGREAKREDRRLRRLARAIGDVRDAEVVLSTFDAVLSELREGARARLGGVRGRLASRLRVAAQPFGEGGKAAGLGRRLRRAAKRCARWAPPRKLEVSRAFGEGFLKGYRRARRAMKMAYAAPSGERFHAWRRAVKTHRHQVFMLETLGSAELAARLPELERLGQWLGDEHDLTTLGAALEEVRESFERVRDRELVARALARRQSELRARARTVGDKLFARSPAALARRATIAAPSL
jgi:CHAD domain-containing protein